MKLLGYLLMTVCLCLGAVAATTSYVPSAGPALEGLTLNAPAGAATLTPELLAAAKARPANVRRAIDVMRDDKIGKPVVGYRLTTGRPDLTADPGAGYIGLHREGDDVVVIVGGYSRRQLAKLDPPDPAPADPAKAPPPPPPMIADDAAAVPIDVPADALDDLADWPVALSFLSVVSLDDETLQKTALDADGVVVIEGDDPDAVPMVQAKDRLSAAVLGALDDARVRVKEFGFARWSYWWLFLIAVAGLVGGGLLVRRETKREIAERAAEVAAGEHSPTAAMARIAESLERLNRELADTPDVHARLEHILDALGDLQQTEVEAVLQSRAVLIGRLGLGRFAEFMDRFSAVERQINRAWSAAADGHEPESMAALAAAHDLAPDAAALLE